MWNAELVSKNLKKLNLLNDLPHCIYSLVIIAKNSVIYDIYVPVQVFCLRKKAWTGPNHLLNRILLCFLRGQKTGGAAGALAIRLGDGAVLADGTGGLIVVGVETLLQPFGVLKPILY